MNSSGTSDIIHATTVAMNKRSVLILGASGRGKSSLALQLIALGATLVADDRTEVWVENDVLLAQAPKTIQGLIEARGIGLLTLPHEGPTPVSLVVDLDKEEPERLPHPHSQLVQGVSLPCLWRASGPHFPAAVLLWLTHNLSFPS